MGRCGPTPFVQYDCFDGYLYEICKHNMCEWWTCLHDRSLYNCNSFFSHWNQQVAKKVDRHTTSG